MVEVPVEYIIVFVTAMFIPLFVYLMKMNNETAKNAARMDHFDDHIKETKTHHTAIELIKQRLEDIENDVKELFRRVSYKRDEYFDNDSKKPK